MSVNLYDLVFDLQTLSLSRSLGNDLLDNDVIFDYPLVGDVTPNDGSNPNNLMHDRAG